MRQIQKDKESIANLALGSKNISEFVSMIRDLFK